MSDDFEPYAPRATGSICPDCQKDVRKRFELVYHLATEHGYTRAQVAEAMGYHPQSIAGLVSGPIRKHHRNALRGWE